MNDRQNSYNQPPQAQQVPMPPRQMMPPPHATPRPRGWRERWMQRFGMNTAAAPLRKGELTIPNWLIGKSIVFFFIAMFACWMAFGYVPEFNLWFVAAISVILFFYGGSVMSKSWGHSKENVFIRNIFIAGFVIRLLWMMYCYFFFNPDYYGTTYGERADVDWYMPFGEAIAQWIRDGFPCPFGDLMDAHGSAIDDIGYPIWLAIVNIITFGESDVFVPFLIKCIVGAYSAVCIYRIAKRHFGDGAARIGALFVALNPNLIYWSGNMFKEAEFVFLCCLCVDLIDKTFTSGRRLTFKSLLPGILTAFSLFFFRSALGIVMFLAMMAHIVMASGKVMSAGKKIIVGILVAATLFVGMGDRLRSQVEHVYETAQSDSQEKNMEWRAKRKESSGTQQSFAKYASAAVFAPLIFTIPFSTFNVANEVQVLQQQLSGGNYIKNILSFFVIVVMIMMLISGEWRRHVFILAYTCGYLACLALSSFAHSSRFHMPIWPFLMLFAAYGIQIAKTNGKVKKWFPMALVIEVVACLAWNWFKLKGRGMI